MTPIGAAGQSQADVALSNQMGAGGSPVGRYPDTQALAALGTTIADAAQVVAASGGFVTASTPDVNKGIKLPVPLADGYALTVKNNSAFTLKVWPHGAGAAFNAAAGGAFYSMAANGISSFVWDATANKWWTAPVVSI